jgi:hypothetical protein
VPRRRSRVQPGGPRDDLPGPRKVAVNACVSAGCRVCDRDGTTRVAAGVPGSAVALLAREPAVVGLPLSPSCASTSSSKTGQVRPRAFTPALKSGALARILVAESGAAANDGAIGNSQRAGRRNQSPDLVGDLGLVGEASLEWRCRLVLCAFFRIVLRGGRLARPGSLPLIGEFPAGIHHPPPAAAGWPRPAESFRAAVCTLPASGASAYMES